MPELTLTLEQLIRDGAERLRSAGLGEPRRRRVLELGRRPEPGPDQLPEHPCVRGVLGSESGSDRDGRTAKTA